jgi:hypothetical protein
MDAVEMVIKRNVKWLCFEWEFCVNFIFIFDDFILGYFRIFYFLV